mgnify:CR=1 FL=1
MFKLLAILLLFTLFSCNNTNTYNGKILNQENLTNMNFKNKQVLLQKLGYPSFIDPIDKKFFYHTEKSSRSTVFNKKQEYNLVFVFKFDEEDTIIESNVFDLNKNEEINLVNNETSNEIIKRGLLEKVFGGVGNNTNLPTTP